MTSGSDYIRDVVRGIWPAQYREGSNLLGAAEDKTPFPDCIVEMMAGSMTDHRLQLHGTEPYIDWGRLPVSQHDHLPQVYELSFSNTTRKFQ